MSYSEAARWLLHVNAFDDTSSKPKGKNLPLISADWLGKLGVIAGKGENLFETLMLNLVLTNDNGEPWDSAVAVWEADRMPAGERVKIGLPQDQAALLTLQSRRVLLRRDGEFVTGFVLLGGDFFEPKDAFAEQMTLWRAVIERKVCTGYLPKRHDSTRSLWRDFSVIAANNGEEKHIPGVVRWHMDLQDDECFDADRSICYQIASVQYGDKDFFVTDVFSDSMTFSAAMLSGMNFVWKDMVEKAIAFCDDMAFASGRLADELDKAAGGDGGSRMQQAKRQYYYNVDVPFLTWLRGIDPHRDDLNAVFAQWKRTAHHIALEVGEAFVREAGDAAIIGRTIEDKKKGKTQFYSAPNAYNRFLIYIGKQMDQEVNA